MHHCLTKSVMQAAILVGSMLGTVVAGAAGGLIEEDLVANKSPLTDSNGKSHTPAHVDPNLLNPWGLTASSTSPFWVSDNGAGVATLYDAAGVARSLVVSIPAPTIPATPLITRARRPESSSTLPHLAVHSQFQDLTKTESL